MTARSTLSKNVQVLKGIKCPDDRKYIQNPIEGEPGLALRTYASGEKRWLYRYRFRDGRLNDLGQPVVKQGLKNLGRFPDKSLQQVCKEVLKLRSQQNDGLLDLAVGTDVHTVRSVAEDWMNKYVLSSLKPTTTKSYRADLNVYILPAIGEMPIGDVRRRDVIELQDEVFEAGVTGKGASRRADQIVTTVSSIYGWAIKQDRYGVEHNPASNIDRKHNNQPRTRVLEEREIAKFWLGCDDVNSVPEIGYIFRLLLLTGKRRSEVTGVPLSELDLDRPDPRWNIDGSRLGAKGNSHTIPLTPYCAELWREAINRFSNGSHVFAGHRTDSTSPHINENTPTRVMRKFRKQIDVDDLTVHDLRRTVRTQMAKLKIPRDISKLCLAHSGGDSGDVHDAVYNQHEYFDEMLEAFQMWEDELLRLVKEHR